MNSKGMIRALSITHHESSRRQSFFKNDGSLAAAAGIMFPNTDSAGKCNGDEEVHDENACEWWRFFISRKNTSEAMHGIQPRVALQETYHFFTRPIAFTAKTIFYQSNGFLEDVVTE